MAVATCALCLLLGCSGGGAFPGHPLGAGAAAEARSGWARSSLPLRVWVEGLSPEEQAALGSIAVCVRGDGPGDGNPSAHEFLFDGEAFRPRLRVAADSLSEVLAYYPFTDGASMGDTVEAGTPGEPFLLGGMALLEGHGGELACSVALRPVTAMLRLRFQSDGIDDVLASVTVSGDGFAAAARCCPLQGTWAPSGASPGTATLSPDCMLNNGRAHDFHVFSLGRACDLVVTLDVGGRDLSLSTRLPPLRPGTMTELGITLRGGRLSVGSSWVDTACDLVPSPRNSIDTVRVGHFLLGDGTVSDRASLDALALVVSTDGHHGKAMALRDNPACGGIWGRSPGTGRVFPTIDGKAREGHFNLQGGGPGCIAFSPGSRYPADCALGAPGGARLTEEMLLGADDRALDAFRCHRVLPTAYLPSLAEMASAAYFLELADSVAGMDPPRGAYATSCESSPDTFYSIDMDAWYMTAYNSRKCNNLKTRLFYLF